VLAYELSDALLGDRLGAESLDHHGNRPRNADRVRDLDFAAACQPRCDDVLRDPAGGIGCRVVDLREVFAGAPVELWVKFIAGVR